MSSRVLPNFHKVRRAEEDDPDSNVEKEKNEPEPEKTKEEKSAERTQAIRNSISKLKSKFNQIRK